MDDAGQAVCKLCNKHINYGSRGAIAKAIFIQGNDVSSNSILLFSFSAKPPWPPYKGPALDPQGGLGGPLDPRPIFLFFHNFPFSSLILWQGQIRSFRLFYMKK